MLSVTGTALVRSGRAENVTKPVYTSCFSFLAVSLAASYM